jgi:hypothetical protein
LNEQIQRLNMSFLRDYLFFNECNEAHTNYHVWSAFVALASTVGRRVWIDYGHQWIYPNIYVVLVGPAGNRKSTAMFLSKDMMRQIGDTHFAAQLESREGLIKQMSSNEIAYLVNGQPKTYMPMTVCVGELKDFLGVSLQNMISFTVAVWDQDYYDYKTRNKEDIIITNPFLCILACDTPEWITRHLRDDVLSGGFSRRNLFVFETTKARRVPFPKVTPEQKDAWDRCVQHGRRLKGVVGQFLWAPNAKAFFEKWYLEMEETKDISLQGYYDSKHVLVLKISMLVALSEGTSLMIEEAHLRTALDLLGSVEKKLPQVFQGIGRNELTQVTNKMIQVLEMHRAEMSEKQLRSILWNDANEQDYNNARDHLHQSGRLVRWKSGQKEMLALTEFVPSAVQQLLARAGEKGQGASGANGQPSPLESTPDDLDFLFRGGQT